MLFRSGAAVTAGLHSARAQDRTTDVWGEPTAEFHFARLVYNGVGAGRRGWSRWDTDYADAEYHLMQGVNRLTRIESNSSPPAARLTLAARSG